MMTESKVLRSNPLVKKLLQREKQKAEDAADVSTAVSLQPASAPDPLAEAASAPTPLPTPATNNVDASTPTLAPASAVDKEAAAAPTLVPAPAVDKEAAAAPTLAPDAAVKGGKDGKSAQCKDGKSAKCKADTSLATGTMTRIRSQ